MIAIGSVELGPRRSRKLQPGATCSAPESAINTLPPLCGLTRGIRAVFDQVSAEIGRRRRRTTATDRIAVNGLGADHDNISALYLCVNDAVSIQHRTIREYAFGPWTSSQRHVLHYHWIDSIASAQSTWTALLLLAKLMVYVTTVRLRGGHILWTVHNVSAHECRHRRIERTAYQFLARSASVLHFPNSAVRSRFAASYGTRLAAKGEFLPLPDPTAVFGQVPRREARAKFGLGEREVVFVALGAQRAYKGTDVLADAFVGLDVPNARLVVAGETTDPAFWDAVRSTLEGDERVTLLPRFLESSEIGALLSAADWIVLPYRSGDNSGLLPAAFAAGVPALVSKLPALTEPSSEDPEAVIASPVGDAEGLLDSLRVAAQMSDDEWRIRSMAAESASRRDNAGLASRYAELYMRAAS